MLGLVVAAILAGVLYLVNGKTGGEIYLASTNFLFFWYIISSVVIFVVFFGWAMVNNLPFTGTLLAFILLLFAIGRGALIGGSYLLHNALTYQNNTYDWNFLMIILGGILIIVSLLVVKITISKTDTKTVGFSTSERKLEVNLNLV